LRIELGSFVSMMKSPRDSTKAVFALAFSTPFLTELVSGNTPLHAMRNPRVIALLLIAYSIPVIVIRETAVRRRLPNRSVFMLGLAYGILNEGSLAQSLMRIDRVPVDRFDSYVYVAGFNVAWACVIVPWHAMLAVVFPLALVSSWFPSVAHTPWLGKRAYSVASAVTIGAVSFLSFAREPRPQMLACLFAMGAFTSIGLSMGRREPLARGPNPRWFGPFLFGGVAYVVFFLGAIVMAAVRVPAPVFFVVLCGVAVAIAVASERYTLLQLPAARNVAWGAYFAPSGFTLAGGLAHHSIERTLTGVACAVTVLLAARGSPD
jgi:hypothetical protein